MLGKSVCLYVYIVLYGGAIISLFVRALLRRRLIKDYDASNAEDYSKNRIINPLFYISNQIKKIRELGQTIASYSDAIQRRFWQFKIITWMTIIVIVLLVIFSLVAQIICGD